MWYTHPNQKQSFLRNSSFYFQPMILCVFIVCFLGVSSCLLHFLPVFHPPPLFSRAPPLPSTPVSYICLISQALLPEFFPGLLSLHTQGRRFGFDTGGDIGNHRHWNAKRGEVFQVSAGTRGAEREREESDDTSYITHCHRSKWTKLTTIESKGHKQTAEP